MSIEQLKTMSLDDLLNIDASRLTSEEIAYVEKRLVKEANRRLSRLKKAKRLSASKITKKERKGFKSFKTPKGYKQAKAGSNRLISSTSRKKKPIDVRNKRAKNVTDIQSFLKKKTTRIRELNAQEVRYRKVINDALGKDLNLSSRQLKRVSKLMSKAQELAGLDPTTKKMSGSPRLLGLVVDMVRSKKYIKNEDVEKILVKAIEEGYEEAQRLINDLNEEDNKGFDLTDDDDFNY